MNLNIFNTANLFEAATYLFQSLGIKLNSNTAEPLPVKDLLKQHYKENDTFKTIGKTYFIGIIDNTVFQATGMFDVNYSYKEALQQGDKNYDGLMLFALELSKQPTRTEISDLTRTFNRISQKMPVALVLKYKTGDEACFSIAISERFKYKQNWRQGEKAGKVIILRDIYTVTTHAGHERILLDLVKPVGVTNYDQLHQHWLQVLDVNILNKKFFQDLANWYFWAMDNVSFPDDLEKKKEVRNATNLIRLITRVVFIWFIKEKSLVPNALFNKSHLDKILKDFNKNNKSQNYYHAILQNLFFGTLNQKMDERKFAKDGGNIKTNGEEYGVKNLFRYADLFTISEKEAMQLFKDVPFLNGGLFDCLDKPNEEGKIVYVDGFSRNPKKQAVVPDYIFFGEEREVDLNDIFATKNKKYKSRGLINLLESYKFTVAENTPIEEEIALDPELLGKVFENLLASYNPETQTTARKQTGSFYTPREIVNYMVDESLLEYIKQNVNNNDSDFETRLRELISYAETPNPFDEAETKALIEAINNCKILDPACGSGAYPMGILHKMVHLLQKLDPGNKLWKAQQRENIIGEQIRLLEKDRQAIKGLSDKAVRAKAEKAVESRLKEIEEIFESENNFDDYARKLYLIENCIYGIDIQPIAVQISKLRFFISLIIDQNKQASKENFGIRSLPNLETKFVAANTLIGLDKPQLKTGDIFLNETFQNIDKLSNALKDLRHKYFTANNRKDKLELQKQDKSLRASISKELQKVGHTKPNADKIASFDPYDQNTFATWFDSEWMFGLTVGFNIVIGNPPYIAGKSGLLSETDKKYFNKAYETAEYQLDTYILFTEKALKILKKGGTLSYIMPNTWLANIHLTKIRKFLLEKSSINEVLIMPDDVFSSAVVDTTIIFCNNQYRAKNQIKISSFKDWNLTYLYEVGQDDFKNNEKYILDIGINQESKHLLNKISKDTIPISAICDVNRGVHAYRKDGYGKTKFGKGYQTERDYNERSYHSDKKIDNTYFKEVRGKNVFPFYYELSDSYVSWGDWLAEPREWKYFEGERIYLRKIVGKTLFASYVNSKNVADQSVYVAKVKKGNKVQTKYLLGILNSILLTWYFRVKANEFDDLFPQIKVTEFKELPIKISNSKLSENLIEVVDKIINTKKDNPNADTLKLENQMNDIVYKIYDLTAEEIKTIEGNE